MQHRSRAGPHARHHGKPVKPQTTHVAPRLQESMEPAFSLFSPDAKRYPLILTLDQNGIPHRWITWHADLRGGVPGVQLWVPTRARTA